MNSRKPKRVSGRILKRSAIIAFSIVFNFFAASLTANAESKGRVQFHLDLVSAYVTKGMDYGDSPAIQPEVTYTFPGSGVVLGVWSSVALLEHDGVRYREIDPYILVPIGNLSLILTDYYLPQLGDIFNYDNDPDAPHTVELSALYTVGKVSIYGALEIGGYDFDKARYLETKYTFYERGGYTAKAYAGAGDEMAYAPGKGDDFALVNTGVTVSKDRFSASLAYNPDLEKTYFVFKASF
jgi:hypothetical protein